VIPREDFGQMFIFSLDTHIFFKERPTISAQRGAESCDAEAVMPKL